MVLLIVTWALIGLIVGAAGYVLIPWALALLGGVEMRDKVGRYFISQMMTVLGDGALVARKQGGVSLASVSSDPDFDADRATVNGETGHLKDDLNVKSRLAGGRFGIGLESHAVYISPLFAEFAERASDAVHRGRVAVRTDGGSGRAGSRLDFEIASQVVAPELRQAYQIFDGDGRRRFGVLAESWAQKSQEKFGRRISIGQTLILIGAFGVGSGMAILAMRYGGSGGGGGGTTLPIQLALGVGL
jgi:hypothetical protein